MSEVQAQQVEPKARESPTRKIPTLKTFQIYRWNPKNPSKHKVKDYQINLKECGPMVLDALNNIQNKIDPSLTFRRSCREGICGSCAMNIDDYNNIACLTKIPLEKNSAAMTITPLPHMFVIKDLVMDMTNFYTNLREVMICATILVYCSYRWFHIPGIVIRFFLTFNLSSLCWCVLCSFCRSSIKLITQIS